MTGKKYREVVRKFASRDDWGAGLKHFAEEVRRAPKDAEARAQLGFFRVKDSRFDTSQAFLDYEAALRLDPRCFAAMLYRAITKASLRDLEGGLADLREARKIGASEAELAYAGGCVELDAGSVEKAIVRFRKWAECEAGSTPAILLSQAYSQAGDHGQALVCAMAARELDRQDFRAPLYAGIYLCYLKRFEEAERELSVAEAMRPEVPLVHHAQAYLARELGNLARAEQHLRLAVGIDPRYVTSWKMLGDICRQLGRIEEARKHYEEALKIFPDYPEARNALQKLR